MDRLDPYRAANLIIQQYGTGAQAHAIQRLQDMRAAGDEYGEWAWMSVFDAVLVLESPPTARQRADVL